jgi:hypothetical protein
MSKYGQTTTAIRDVNELVDALCDTGKWTRNQIEVTESPCHLYGYHGDVRSETAEVIIRRKHIGSLSNDIGFKRNADGTFGAIVSDYDRSIGYGNGWLKKVEVNYADRHTRNMAAKQGFKFSGVKTVNGKRELLFVRG